MGWEVVLQSLMQGPSPGASAVGDHTVGVVLTLNTRAKKESRS